MKLSFSISALITLGAISVSDAHGDGHHHESCACEAQELGFDIDCSQRDLILNALSKLQANSCDTDCSSDECHKNFLIVQAHHDYCLHDEVPPPVEDAFHDFEGTCEECSIAKKFDPDLVNCPPSFCDDSGDRAYQAMLISGCLDNCDTPTCITNYRILRSEHDTCDGDVLSQSSETGLHDFEEVCEAFNCNVLTDESLIAAQLVCERDFASTAPPHALGSFTMTAVGMTLFAALT